MQMPMKNNICIGHCLASQQQIYSSPSIWAPFAYNNESEKRCKYTKTIEIIDCAAYVWKEKKMYCASRRAKRKAIHKGLWTYI